MKTPILVTCLFLVTGAVSLKAQHVPDSFVYDGQYFYQTSQNSGSTWIGASYENGNGGYGDWSQWSDGGTWYQGDISVSSDNNNWAYYEDASAVFGRGALHLYDHGYGSSGNAITQVDGADYTVDGDYSYPNPNMVDG